MLFTPPMGTPPGPLRLSVLREKNRQKYRFLIFSLEKSLNPHFVYDTCATTGGYWGIIKGV